MDADIEDIAAGIGMDSRIGTKFLRAGAGLWRLLFSKRRGCLSLGGQRRAWTSGCCMRVEKINEEQERSLLQKVRPALWTLRGKRLARWAWPSKGGTDDIRESPAIEIVQKLLSEGCIVSAYDPAAEARTKELIPPGTQMRYVDSPYAAPRMRMRF